MGHPMVSCLINMPLLSALCIHVLSRVASIYA